MSELRQALLADSAHTPPAHILEALPEPLAHALVPGAPHSIYAELWHITFWLQNTLDWSYGIETPYPEDPHTAFPTEEQTHLEPWDNLRSRFEVLLREAAGLTDTPATLATEIACPSRPGQPTRTMSVADQLLSLAAHNSYHFGRIVLLRQLLGTWPPPSGGYTW